MRGVAIPQLGWRKVYLVVHVDQHNLFFQIVLLPRRAIHELTTSIHVHQNISRTGLCIQLAYDTHNVSSYVEFVKVYPFVWELSEMWTLVLGNTWFKNPPMEKQRTRIAHLYVVSVSFLEPII